MDSGVITQYILTDSKIISLLADTSYVHIQHVFRTVKLMVYFILYLI